MSPAKKKREPEQEASSKLREAIVSRIQGAEEGEQQPPAAQTAPASREPAAAGGPSGLRREIAFFGPRLRDMTMFCRQLATLLDVGIPLLRSLKILSQRTQHPRLKEVVGQVANEVEQGNRLSAALAEHPKVFSPLFVNVAQIGEAGGILEGSMKRLAEIFESKMTIRRRILAACTYPFAAILIATIILLGIMVFAIPKFEEIYAPMKEAGQLPRVTVWLLGISHVVSYLVKNHWLSCIIVIVAIVVALKLFARSVPGKRFFDWCRLNVPLLRGVNVKISIARTTRTLSNLVTAGVPLLEALRVTSDSSENVYVAESLGRVRDRVEGGGSLEEQMRQETRVFPPIVTDMVAIGDEAGALDTMLTRLADTYDEDVDATLRGLSAIVEPILIVLLGFVVVFIALALLWPYFRLAKTLAAE